MMRALLIAAVIVFAPVMEVSAQLVTPPPRSTNGVFGGSTVRPNQSGHQLSVDALALGSYEDLTGDTGLGGASVTSDPLAENRSGPTALLVGNVLYRYGRLTRYIQADGRGFLHSFRGLDIRPLSGGDLDVRGGTNVGRASLSTGASASYRPTLMLNAAPSGPLDLASGASAPVDPTNGAVRTESTSRALTSSFDFNWNVRHNTSAAFGYSDTLVTGRLLTTTSQSYNGTLTHSWAFQRTMTMDLQYQYSDQAMEIGQLPAHPNDSHEARLGFEWRKRLSRTRTISLGGASGVMRVRSISSFEDRPLEYLAPSVSARSRLDLGRTWAIAADADRNVTVLDGITPQSFLTDVGSLWLGGNIRESWQVAISGSFSRGAPHVGETGSYEAAVAQAQLRFNLATCCGIVGTYSYYSHLLRGVAHVTPGFPSRSEHNAVRVGMTFWLPLYGRFVGTR